MRPIQAQEMTNIKFLNAVITANAVQLFLTVQSFYLSQAFNTIVLAREFYQEHYIKASGLRVSCPKSPQRRTHRLTVPLYLCWIIPAITTGLTYLFSLHWYVVVFSIIDLDEKVSMQQSVAVTDHKLAGARGLKDLVWCLQGILCAVLLLAIFNDFGTADKSQNYLPIMGTKTATIAWFCINRAHHESHGTVLCAEKLRFGVLPGQVGGGLPKLGFSTSAQQPA
jgi:hypothetical protein